MNHELDRLERRIASLERTRRRWTAVTLFCGALAAAGLAGLRAQSHYDRPVAGQEPSHYEEPVQHPALTARSLTIVDDRGKAVLYAGVRGGGGDLWIANAAGDPVLKLNQAADGSGRIAVLGAGGREAVIVSARGERGDVWAAPGRGEGEPGRE